MGMGLTWEEVEEAAIIGVKRRCRARRLGRSGAAEHQSGNKPGWRIDVDAAIAEQMYAKWSNQSWHKALSPDPGPDVGPDYVRHAPNVHHSLIIRPGDDLGAVHVLVVGSFPDLRFAGWIWGKDSQNEKWIRNPNNREPAWFVPQSALRDMSQLQFVLEQRR